MLKLVSTADSLVAQSLGPVNSPAHALMLWKTNDLKQKIAFSCSLFCLLIFTASYSYGVCKFLG